MRANDNKINIIIDWCARAMKTFAMMRIFFFIRYIFTVMLMVLVLDKYLII